MVIGRKLSASLKRFFASVLVLITISVAAMPFLWMVSSSFKDRKEIYTYPPVWIPKEPTFDGYLGLLQPDIYGNAGFQDFTVNSIFVSLTTSIVSIVMSGMGAYAMSRFRLKGNTIIKYIILMSQMLPGALLLIPLYLLVNKLGLINTHWSLIIAYISFTLPYCTYILKNYFDSIPRALDEAAMIDGCNRFGALFRVIFPLAAPGIVVTFVSAFIMAWNEFMFALVFLNSYKMWTLPIAIGNFQGQYLVDWGYLFAASTIVTLPVLILFLVLQKWLTTGFVSGAIKA